MFLSCANLYVTGQPTVVTADGPGNTYELINSKLAPGYDVIETPECIHGAFGRHITEVWDTELNQYVFSFFSHVAEDNDRCINLDRQRTEIKTYDKSPANLIGIRGEIIRYTWRFKIPVGYKPSSNFTHIHQIKPVNGDDGDPMFTLTLRKGTPNKLELIHNDLTKVAILNLSLFEGKWVEATEVVKVGAEGSYSMRIVSVADNAVLLDYSNSKLMTIRPDNDFVRPKWGIYRSLLNKQDLRDESILFNNFSIEELEVSLASRWLSFAGEANGKQVSLNWSVAGYMAHQGYTIEHAIDGQQFTVLDKIQPTQLRGEEAYFSYTHKQPVAGINYYRVQYTESSGEMHRSEVIAVALGANSDAYRLVYPNPISGIAKLQLPDATKVFHMQLLDAGGRIVCVANGLSAMLNEALNKALPSIPAGVYMLHCRSTDQVFYQKILKQ